MEINLALHWLIGHPLMSNILDFSLLYWMRMYLSSYTHRLRVLHLKVDENITTVVPKPFMLLYPYLEKNPDPERFDPNNF